MLRVTQLDGFGVGSSSAVWTVDYTANSKDTTDATTYTYSGLAIGTDVSNRKVVVATIANGTSAATVSTVTVGGVAATSRLSVQDGNKTLTFHSAEAVSGTTGDVVVTYSAGRVRAACTVWAVYGDGSMTPSDTGSAVGTGQHALNDTINCPAGGVIIGAHGDLSGGGDTSTTWAGLTERHDTAGPEAGVYSGASDAFAAAQSALSITATGAGGTPDNPILALVSFGPA